MADVGLCVGRHWLFDSTDPADHEVAARLCARCPVLTRCQEALVDERSRPKTGRTTGTWAGALLEDQSR